jgi:hypothetical protein
VAKLGERGPSIFIEFKVLILKPMSNEACMLTRASFFLSGVS